MCLVLMKHPVPRLFFLLFKYSKEKWLLYIEKSAWACVNQHWTEKVYVLGM